MNGMQQMLQNVKKLQREYEKAHKELEDKEFAQVANGLVKVTLKGNFELVKVEILDNSLSLKEDEEAIEDAIVLAYQKCKEAIDKEDEKLMEKFQKQPGGMFF